MTSGRHPDFTVIIPTYNRSKPLARAMRSALSVGAGDLELIVVDDASDDDTESVVEALSDPRVRFHRMARRSGAPAARNVGIELARGEYLAFLDSDDVMLPERLGQQRASIRRQEGAVASTGGFVTVGRGHARHGFSTIGHAAQVRRFLRLRHGALTSSVIMVRRSTALEVMWDESLPALQDYDFALRVAAKGRVAATAARVALKSRSAERVYSGLNVINGRAAIIRKYRYLLADDPVALRRQYRALLQGTDSPQGAVRAQTDLPPEVAEAREYLRVHTGNMVAVTDAIKRERVFGRAADLLLRVPESPVL